MKTLLLIGFKIVEVALIVAAYFPLCWVGYKIEYLISGSNEFGMFNPFSLAFTIALLSMILLIILLFHIFITVIPGWIALNKKWVDKLLK